MAVPSIVSGYVTIGAMPHASPPPLTLSKAAGRAIWLHAQRLEGAEPFGRGLQATPAAVAHLGYVQIDTIAVIERCHHHILWTRIPGYRREHLHQAQSADKTVFEYWTHALAYVPTADLRFFLPAMQQRRQAPRSAWYATVTDADVRKVLARIRRDGPLSIRDIDDDVLVEKDHAWASRKPSKRALQLAFFEGRLAVSERAGMLKTYELMARHFGWQRAPKPATARQVIDYRLDRALRAQGLVSLDSICHLQPAAKPVMLARIDARVRRGALRPVVIEGATGIAHWATPEAIELAHTRLRGAPPRVHLLSPFDPLIIQRKRLELFFGYRHRFEAYVPAPRRVLGYFALPVLIGDRIVAAIDLKTDRRAGALTIQQWTWIGAGSKAQHGAQIDAALARFERFQLAD